MGPGAEDAACVPGNHAGVYSSLAQNGFDDIALAQLFLAPGPLFAVAPLDAPIL
jgi:hypothetical protein